jgi:hypothetical protein
MANCKRAAVANGVLRIDWTRGYWLKGTQEGLIAGGYASAEWFPTEGERDYQGRFVRSKKLLIPGSTVREVRKPARGPCAIYFLFTPDELRQQKVTQAQERTSPSTDASERHIFSDDLGFEVFEWGRRYRGTSTMLWDAGVMISGQMKPTGNLPQVIGSTDDQRRTRIRRTERAGVFEVDWPYKAGEERWIPQNQRRLENLAKRIRGISAVIGLAAAAVESKSMMRDWTTADSSKLGRAIDDLEIASDDISEVRKQILDTMTKGITERSMCPPDEDDVE